SQKSHLKIKKLQPIAKEVLAALHFPNGKPLPPSLAHFLAFDASWLIKEFRWFKAIDKPKFQLLSLPQFIKKHSQPFEDLFKMLKAQGISADCLELDAGSDSARLLYLGEQDEYGEYPVIDIDVDDVPQVMILWPGFDVWLAVESGMFGNDFITNR